MFYLKDFFLHSPFLLKLVLFIFFFFHFLLLIHFKHSSFSVFYLTLCFYSFLAISPFLSFLHTNFTLFHLYFLSFSVFFFLSWFAFFGLFLPSFLLLPSPLLHSYSILILYFIYSTKQPLHVFSNSIIISKWSYILKQKFWPSFYSM